MNQKHRAPEMREKYTRREWRMYCKYYLNELRLAIEPQGLLPVNTIMGANNEVVDHYVVCGGHESNYGQFNKQVGVADYLAARGILQIETNRWLAAFKFMTKDTKLSRACRAFFERQTGYKIGSKRDFNKVLETNDLASLLVDRIYHLSKPWVFPRRRFIEPEQVWNMRVGRFAKKHHNTVAGSATWQDYAKELA